MPFGTCAVRSHGAPSIGYSRSLGVPSDQQETLGRHRSDSPREIGILRAHGRGRHEDGEEQEQDLTAIGHAKVLSNVNTGHAA